MERYTVDLTLQELACRSEFSLNEEFRFFTNQTASQISSQLLPCHKVGQALTEILGQNGSKTAGTHFSSQSNWSLVRSTTFSTAKHSNDTVSCPIQMGLFCKSDNSTVGSCFRLFRPPSLIWRWIVQQEKLASTVNSFEVMVWRARRVYKSCINHSLVRIRAFLPLHG